MYINNIKFIEEDSTGCFKKDESYSINENIILLVGDQGVGKSTLLNILQQHKKCCQVKLTDLGLKGIDTWYFDAEKMNPRTKDPNLYSTINGQDKGIGYVNALTSRFKSHGEVLREFTVNAIRQAHDAVIFLDEPESALSIKNQKKLVIEIHEAVKRNCQFIIATHNYFLIKSVKTVLSLEHKKWMTAESFLNL